MRWREALQPVGMVRVALLAPSDSLRDLLVNVADQGTVALGEVPAENGTAATGPATARLRRLHTEATAAASLATSLPDLDRCEQAGRLDLIAGEAQVEQRSAQALVRGSVAGLVGWVPADRLAPLAERLASVGGAVVPLARPLGIQPPTQLSPTGVAHEFAPLVDTYSTVPYADVNPSLLAGLAYIAMFGMMFADVGHGALLLLAAIAARLGWWSRLASLRRVWLFLAGAGAASMLFGALYGEFFGPTGVIPTLWLPPLDHPLELLGAALAVGALLLAGAYALGTVNRFREGGWRRAVFAPSGLAGATLFLGLGVTAASIYLGEVWLGLLGGAVALAGLATSYAGLLASAGGGAAGATEAAIELFDLVLRLGSNLVSFARLAAFGLTHAALGAVIWQATTGLWPRGLLGAAAAVVVFVAGNALAFALEGLVAAIQALRLEYYELFSRVFDSEGEPFRPWHVPLDPTEVPC
ncbi:MAG TPA: V-type ATPase 116kDa subunit family protein [Pedococcus sp.]|nr:V-type ATPase 116kDa subunit family protein [Pedococcus sp.]